MRTHITLVVLAALTLTAHAADWRDDPGWSRGPAEWALYDAVRPIYGVDRHYEATIFTNVQRMDPATTTKADDWRRDGLVEVFKHNVSELIPTEHYTYRFLTTAFVRRDDLTPFKLAVSTQEDCGSTYKQLVVEDDQVSTVSHCYFPGAGERRETYRRPGRAENFAFHDALTLTLRSYPFDAEEKPVLRRKIVPDQTDTHETPIRPEEATVRYAGRETIEVPYGEVDAHHLVVEFARDGGATPSEYWFAAAPKLRHVLVKYRGPYGVRYELKALGWWAYWDRSTVRPDRR